MSFFATGCYPKHAKHSQKSYQYCSSSSPLNWNSIRKYPILIHVRIPHPGLFLIGLHIEVRRRRLFAAMTNWGRRRNACWQIERISSAAAAEWRQRSNRGSSSPSSSHCCSPVSCSTDTAKHSIEAKLASLENSQCTDTLLDFRSCEQIQFWIALLHAYQYGLQIFRLEPKSTFRPVSRTSANKHVFSTS